MIASVGLHAALAVAIILVVRSQPEIPPPAPGLDTRDTSIVLRSFSAEIPIVVKEPDPHPVPVPVPVPNPNPNPNLPNAIEDSGVSRPPFAQPIPPALSPEMLAVIRRPLPDADVKPASAAIPSAPPIHGAMKAGQVVVYVIDCSGSMGEYGKLALARAALIATLRGQPEGVRFQVIAYNNTARVIAGAGTVSATPANVAAAEASVLALESAGTSHHAAAVRLAVQARPDVILLLTDAEDLAVAPLRAALAGANRPTALYTAKVAAAGIQSPKELR